jgi:DNA-directed RNA polymerase specialized sigma24 family protein
VDHNQIVKKAFKKYKWMKKVAATVYHPKVVASYNPVVVQGGTKTNYHDILLDRKLKAEQYIYLMDQALDLLDDSERQPHRSLIRMKHLENKSITYISMVIQYSESMTKQKLKEAREELTEIIELWEIDIEIREDE